MPSACEVNLKSREPGMKRANLLLLLSVWISSLNPASTSSAQEKNITWPKDGKEMVLIPGGSFEMGDHYNEGKSHEQPGRRWN